MTINEQPNTEQTEHSIAPTNSDRTQDAQTQDKTDNKQQPQFYYCADGMSSDEKAAEKDDSRASDTAEPDTDGKQDECLCCDKTGEKHSKPIVMLASVKGGSGKTYSAISLAFTLTRHLNAAYLNKPVEGSSRKNILPTRVCVIDLDLSATNMRTLLSTVVDKINDRDNVSLEQRQSIHEYLVAAPRRSSNLDNYISYLTYPADMTTQNYERIDFILGTSDARWMRLFSQSRISNYENSVSEPEARTLLYQMLDEVISRNYDAVILDMQPGMEGLCHAAIEYFTSSSGNEYFGNGFHSKAVKELYEQYTPNLCFTSTSDWTQMCGNMNWMMSQLALCRRVKKKHVLIKDNQGLIEDAVINGVFKIKQIFYERILTALMSAGDSCGSVSDRIQSVAVLRNNKNYVDLFCKQSFFGDNAAGSSVKCSAPEYFCYSGVNFFELTEWAVNCLLS